MMAPLRAEVVYIELHPVRARRDESGESTDAFKASPVPESCAWTGEATEVTVE